MIRHIVRLKFRDDATAAERDFVLAGLAELPSLIESVRSLTFGPDAGLAEGNFDIGLVAEFDDAASFRSYAQHPAHIAFVTDRVKPILANRVALQFEAGA